MGIPSDTLLLNLVLLTILHPLHLGMHLHLMIMDFRIDTPKAVQPLIIKNQPLSRRPN